MKNKETKPGTPGTSKPVPSDDPHFSQQDDPTSAQDDPELPDEEALIPFKSDVSAKESLEYFTPSDGSPDDDEAAEEDATPEIIPGTEADVTAEDLAALGPRDEDMDMGEDESLRARDVLVKQTDDASDEEPAEALDVPGAEADDDVEDMGMEDEENNEYSLGGDKD